MKNNLKILSHENLFNANDRYEITLENNKIKVKGLLNGKITFHDSEESFAMNMKSMGKRITFSKEAIAIWKELLFDGFRYSLFDVQNAANKLYLLYQDVTKNTVQNALIKGEI